MVFCVAPVGYDGCGGVIKEQIESLCKEGMSKGVSEDMCCRSRQHLFDIKRVLEGH